MDIVYDPGSTNSFLGIDHLSGNDHCFRCSVKDCVRTRDFTQLQCLLFCYIFIVGYLKFDRFYETLTFVFSTRPTFPGWC